MKIIKFSSFLYFIASVFLIAGGCEEIEEDPCLKTKWPHTKELEIKLAVHVNTSNPNLPGGTPESLNPADFEKISINGTIEKIECNDHTTGPINLGNCYINKSIDWPAPIDVPKAYWIGHVVYVFEFGNDKDHINVNLEVKITMKDNQSYVCNVSEVIYYPKIVRMPMEMYYYILLDIHSDNWYKV